MFTEILESVAQCSNVLACSSGPFSCWTLTLGMDDIKTVIIER